jgi:FkbM family methyltransferase
VLNVDRIGRLAITAYLFLKHGQIRRYYLPRILFQLRLGNRYIKREILGNQMYLDLRDEGLSRDLLKMGRREVLAVDLVHQEVRPGDVVADIGSNIGYYALQEARLVGDQGKVYAIEPAPENAELLRRNVELNGYQNVEIFQLALGNENGTKPFYLSRKRNWSSMITRDEAASTIIGQIPVQEATFDGFFSKIGQYPSFIRMDVEGYEVEIIEGMHEFLEGDRDLRILMEVHPDRGPEIRSMFKTLEEHGFQCKAVVNEPDAPELLIRGEPEFLRRMFQRCNERLGVRPSGSFGMTMEELIEGDFLSQATWLHVLLERK